MKAKLNTALHVVLVTIGLWCLSVIARGEVAASANFEVHAHTKDFASAVAEKAERCRYEIAVEWLGEPLPANWNAPCVVRCEIKRGAGGATSFARDGGEVFGWTMKVQGSEREILDDVIPHEVTHTIIQSHFRGKKNSIPRWADEGMAMMAERPEGRDPFVRDAYSRGLRPMRPVLNQCLDTDMSRIDVPMVYGQGYLFTSWLVERKDRQTFIAFIDDAGKPEIGWDGAASAHYGASSFDALDAEWRRSAGSVRPYERSVASASGSREMTPPVSVSDKPEMIVYTASWCGPCQQWKGEYSGNREFREAIDARYRVVIRDIDQHRREAERCGVRSVPAFVVNGRVIHQGYRGWRPWCLAMGIPGVAEVHVGPFFTPDRGVVTIPPRRMETSRDDQPSVPMHGDIDEIDYSALTLVIAINSQTKLFQDNRAALADRIEQRVKHATLDNGVPISVRVLSNALDGQAYRDFAAATGIGGGKITPVLLVPERVRGLRGLALGPIERLVESVGESVTPLVFVFERTDEAAYRDAREALESYDPGLSADLAHERFGGLSIMQLLLIAAVALVVRGFKPVELSGAALVRLKQWVAS